VAFATKAGGRVYVSVEPAGPQPAAAE